jgi:RNA polymerase sigma factor (sigma-70 family)
MSGDLVASDFDEVFRSVYPRAFAVALRILGSVPDAEDAAADGLARALVDWPRVRQLPHRDAWILRVTINVSIDMARRRVRHTNEVPQSASNDDASVLRLTLVSALSALPRRQREAIVMRHMAGFSERDVAAALGVSQNTAKKHLQRGMLRLRSDFDTTEGAALGFD